VAFDAAITTIQKSDHPLYDVPYQLFALNSDLLRPLHRERDATSLNQMEGGQTSFASRGPGVRYALHLMLLSVVVTVCGCQNSRT
jgi:hypothetical protein